MVAKILIIGASGRIGSLVVNAFDTKSESVHVRLATSRPEQADAWRSQGREAVVLDLDRPEGFDKALADVDRVFLLTGYTSDMLYQSKKLVDAAVDAGVSHIVHLGVFTSRRDAIPHFTWHDLVESYIEASGVSWTHLHPNVIADSILATETPPLESGSFYTFGCDAKQGPEKHGGNNYFLSIEALTGNEVAKILSVEAARPVKCLAMGPAAMEDMFSKILSVQVRAYMASAVITAKLTLEGTMEAQNKVHADMQTVLGRRGTTMATWARNNLPS
ncbi:hypothetical protein MBLNU230_g8606t1 [Neophaeotheca triangularis]